MLCAVLLRRVFHEEILCCPCGGGAAMLNFSSSVRIFIATDPVDFRKSSDGYSRSCRTNFG